MKTHSIILTSLLILALPISVEASGPIYISQIQITGGEGKTKEDFIELFNPNDAPFNLKGFRLVKRTEKGISDTSIKSWTDDTIIPPKSFYLWANSTFTSITTAPDVKTTATISDDNGIAIRQGPEDTGAIIDSASWGKADNGFAKISADNPLANKALVRSDLYSAVSAFVIAVSSPRNSVNSLNVSASPPPPPPVPTPAPQTQTPAVQPSQSTATTSEISAPAQNSQPATATPPSQTSQNQTQTQNQGPPVSQPANQNPAPAQGLILGSQTKSTEASGQFTANLPQEKKPPANKLAVKEGQKNIQTRAQTKEPQEPAKLAQIQDTKDQSSQAPNIPSQQNNAEPAKKPIGYLALSAAALALFGALVYFSFLKKTGTKEAKKPNEEDLEPKS